MFFIYGFLYALVVILILPFEYLKRPREIRWRWLEEKLGFIHLPSSKGNASLIWVHAVSVGEVISAVPFIRELKRRFPSVSVVISTITDTGQKLARERLSDIADAVYLPFDRVAVLKRLLKSVRPDVFITIETELWPNIFRIFKQAAIPILVLNGRLSDNSFRGYRKIRFFIKEVLGCVDVFCMQDAVYAERVKALGVDEEKIRVIGNFKFDTKPPDKFPEWAGLLDGPVVIAGSTHEGEDEVMISALKMLRKDVPSLNFVIAPRHPDRFKKVEEMVKTSGLSYVKRSELSAVSHQSSAMNEKMSGTVIILDTIGELASAYCVAEIAIICGSFVDHGGHNPLEPASCGKPVVCGPYMGNFPFIEDFYRGGGAVKSTAEELSDVIGRLLEAPDERKRMGERARVLYDEKAGAVNRAIEILEGYLKPHLLVSEEKPLSHNSD